MTWRVEAFAVILIAPLSSAFAQATSEAVLQG